MADLHEVEDRLVAWLAAVAYPGGTGQPSAVTAPVRVFRGWPDPDRLAADLAAGACTITVFPRPGVTTVEPAFGMQWERLPGQTPSLTAVVDEAAGTVTFGGSAATPGMVAAVFPDNGSGAAYAVQPNDVPADAAAALAALLPGASASAAVLTVPGAWSLKAVVAAGGDEARVLRWVRQGFQLSLWCPTPQLRDALGKLVDLAIADTARLALPDGTAALLEYQTTLVDDAPRGQPLYRRDFMVAVRYPATAERTGQPPVVAGEGGVAAPTLDDPVRVVVVNTGTPS